ncbi:hypothetical protein ACIRN4_26350 [Pimelobacter simplex]|uniref:hypothetical protein n=1 Tax=Nocardioides simplex TaxID=2045 RepID=UPI0037F9B6E7
MTAAAVPVRRGVPALAVALVLTLALAGCGGGAPAPGPSAGSSTASPRSGPSATGAATDPATTTIRRPDVTVPRKVVNRPAARDRVTVTGCRAADGGWSASGRAVGRRAGADQLTITVFFTTEQATVVAWGQTTVDVPDGRSAEWSVRANLPVEGELRCVLRGVG